MDTYWKMLQEAEEGTELIFNKGTINEMGAFTVTMISDSEIFMKRGSSEFKLNQQLEVWEVRSSVGGYWGDVETFSVEGLP